ncbi:bifunctional metallophosphatase/5'-nucleotidase [Limibacillus halophilus]|jgi:5'-nucleotidase/UDP-sugar diphosphatase
MPITPLFRQLLLGGLFALSLLLSGVSGAFAQSGKITLLSINDVYEIAPKGGKGGFAPLMTLLKEQRAAHEHTVFAVGGDFLSPSLLSGLTQGEQMVEFFNALGVEFVAFGNHEFDFGPEVVKQRIAESDFAWLGTNLLDAEGKPFGGSVLTASKQMGEIKVGFFGLLTPETESLSSPHGVAFQPPLEAAAAAVESLKAEGAQVIVGLTHLSLADDIALARGVKGIHVILGGHDHNPITYVERGVVIQKAGYDAHYLAATHLDIQTVEGRKGPELQVTPSWELISTAGVAHDPEIEAMVQNYETMLDDSLGQVIGKTEVALDSRRAVIRIQESNIGNLIADAMREAVEADIGLTNAGGIRGDKVYEAGQELTRRDILTELPFGNLTVKLELTGAEVLAALENGFSQVEEVAGRFPQVSGMTVTFNPTLPAGQRVVSVEVGGETLDPARTYTLATNDYIAAGGDGYAVFRDAKNLIDASGAVLMATTVMDHVTAKGSVAPTVEGRVVAVQ